MAQARGGEGANQITIAKQVIDQLGDELTIGIAAAEQADSLSLAQKPDEAVKQLVHKRDLLDELSKKNFGLTLLHGHNDEHMFTKLPEGYVSVVSDGTTSFRKEEEVLADPTFVPNVWRSVNGKLRVAGGHSELASGEA